MHMVFCIHRRFLFALWLPAFALLLVASGGAHGASIDPDRPTVLITGSNRGIGLAFVRHYVEAGWNVAASRQKKIVSITSGAGSVSRETVSTGGAYYGISKSALNMAMRKVGAELAEQGIVVTLVAPGPVVTW